jgi:hypothetical protein
VSEVHRAALYESLYNELIDAEPLLIVGNLKKLFGDGLRAAGECSKLLVEEVKKMCLEANTDAKEGNIFVFDAKKLLKIRYQPKFCSSVEVKKRPFRGTQKSKEHHMALHLSEVF